MAKDALNTQSAEIDKLGTAFGSIVDQLAQAHDDLKAALANQGIDDAADIQSNTDKIDALLARAQAAVSSPSSATQAPATPGSGGAGTGSPS